MSLVPEWMLSLAGFSPRRTVAEGRAAQSRDRMRLEQEQTQDEQRFVEHQQTLRSRAQVPFGTTATGEVYAITLEALVSLPWWITAATGVGKSRFVGGLMDAVLRHGRRGEAVSVVLIDGKGESADNLLRSLARLAGEMPVHERPRLYDQLHTFRFFDRTVLPSWPLLHRVQGVAVETQASTFADVLCDVVGDATVGARQRATLAAVLAVAIEFDVPMVQLPWLLAQPKRLSELGARSTSPSVRLDLSRLERESQNSIDGLVARLGTLLRIPSLKAVLSGARPFDFAQCFEPGAVSVFDFGGAELGAEAGVRAMGSLAISALVNAAFDPRRTVRGATLIVVDEPQTLLTSITAGQFERLVTLGRSFGAGGLVCVHQGATQLPAELQNVLNTNIPLRIIGRSSERDAQASSEWLPRTGRVPRGREPGARTSTGFLSVGEEERFRVAELGRLPPRHFLIADRRVPFASRIVQATEYIPPPWTRIDPAIVERVRRGTIGVPRTVLEARVRELEQQAAQAFERERVASENTRTRRSRPQETPDVIGPARRRVRRGEMP